MGAKNPGGKSSISSPPTSAQQCGEVSRCAVRLRPARRPHVHFNRAAIELRPVQRRYRVQCLLSSGKFDDTLALRELAAAPTAHAPRIIPLALALALIVALHEDLCMVDGACLAHEVLQALPPCLEGDIANVHLERIVHGLAAALSLRRG